MFILNGVEFKKGYFKILMKEFIGKKKLNRFILKGEIFERFFDTVDCFGEGILLNELEFIDFMRIFESKILDFFIEISNIFSGF
jgi:hypothetical protein